MGLFPWDDLFYHLSQKSQHLNDLYNTYVHQRDQINIHGDLLRMRVEDLQYIIGYTNALLICSTVGVMTDDNYKQFMSNQDMAKPAAPKQPTVSQIIEGISELAGFAQMGISVYKYAKLIKQKFFSESAEEAGEAADEDVTALLSDEAVEVATEAGIDEAGDALSASIVDAASNAGAETGTEAGVEAVGEAVAESSLSAVSVACAAGGIFAALGIDMILGAINGSKEAKKLDAATARMQAALDKVTAFIGHLDKDTKKAENELLNQINAFIKVMNVLNHVQTAKFTYEFPVALEYLPQWKHSVQKAADQYFYISTIRHDFNLYLENWKMDNPDKSFTATEYKAWKTMEKTQRPAFLTQDEAAGFLSYVEDHSDDMKVYGV